MTAFTPSCFEFCLYEQSEATLILVVCCSIVSEVESTEEDVKRLSQMILFYFKGKTGMLELCWSSSTQSQMRVHGRLCEFLLSWVIQTNFDVEGSLSRSGEELV